MKTLIILMICFFSFELQAACKCNCNPADFSICASNYDLDQPCPVICSSAAPGLAPMITACPIVKVTNPNTGVTTSVNMCNE